MLLSQTYIESYINLNLSLFACYKSIFYYNLKNKGIMLNEWFECQSIVIRPYVLKHFYARERILSNRFAFVARLRQSQGGHNATL